MLSGREEISQPSPSHTRITEGLPDGRREADPEPVQDNLHDIVKSAPAEPSEGSHEHTLIEKRTFEIEELEQGALHIRPSLHTSESHPHSRGIEEESHDVSIGNLERDSKAKQHRDAVSGDVLHG